jgi:hypothetical protein
MTSTSTIGRVVEKHCPSLAMRVNQSKRVSTSIFRDRLDSVKDAHPLSDHVGGEVVIRIEHVTAVVTELGVAESKEFEMPSTNCNPIFQSAKNPRVDLVEMLPVRGRLYFPLIFIGD